MLHSECFSQFALQTCPPGEALLLCKVPSEDACLWPPWPWRGEGHPCALPANSVPQAHLPRGSDLQLRLQGGRRQAVSTSAHLETCHSHRGDQVHPVPSAPNPAPCTGPRLMQACPGARSLAPAPVSPPSPTLSLPRPCPLPASSLPVIPAGSGLSFTFLGTFWRFWALPQWKEPS